MRSLPIAKPCHESFAAMTGDGQRRHCASCDKDVHDLSAGTEADARAILAAARARRERVCVRYTPDASGNIHFRAAMVVAAVAAGAALAACSAADVAPVAAQPVVTPVPDGGSDVNPRLQPLMGDIDPDYEQTR